MRKPSCATYIVHVKKLKLAAIRFSYILGSFYCNIW